MRAGSAIGVEIEDGPRIKSGGAGEGSGEKLDAEGSLLISFEFILQQWLLAFPNIVTGS
jgi:hypothetical protein